MRVRRVLLGVAIAAVIAPAGAFADTGAPDPGGDRKALVPIPPVGKYFGYLDLSAGIPSRGVSAGELATAARRSGATLHRFIVQWHAVESSPNINSEGGWSQFTELAEELRIRGVRPLVTLSGVPPWAREEGEPQECVAERGCEYPPAEDMLDEWAEFAAEVVRRIPGAVVETWNEPDFANFFKPEPDPQRWADLHVAAYDAIKAEDPTATVLAGGFTGNVNEIPGPVGSVNTWVTREFLGAAYPAIRGKLDGLSVHIYPQRPFGIGAGTTVASTLADLRKARREGNDRSRPIWVTELGISTTGVAPLMATEAEQAAGLLGGVRQLLTMPDVEAALIHVLSNNLEAKPDSRLHGFGVVETIDPLVPKPAYCEFAARAGTAPESCPVIKDGKKAKRKRKKLAKTCRSWHKPTKAWRKASMGKRANLVAECLLDAQVLTAAAGKKAVKKIDRKANGKRALKLLAKQIKRQAKRA